jgi:hypothetical protein
VIALRGTLRWGSVFTGFSVTRLGTVNKAYRVLDNYAAVRLRRWLRFGKQVNCQVTVTLSIANHPASLPTNSTDAQKVK